MRAPATDASLDLNALMAELRLYLVAVEAFRAEGREPVWLREERDAWEPPRGTAAPTRTAG